MRGVIAEPMHRVNTRSRRPYARREPLEGKPVRVALVERDVVQAG
jgi:hypothetical protein